MHLPTIETARLKLRPWRAEDIAPFAALNADLHVMRFFPKPLDRAETEDLVSRIEAHFAERGFGFWAVEIKGGAPFIGMVGMIVPAWEAACTPCHEIGWRLAEPFWGKGYASEAAGAVLDYGFGTLGIDEIIAVTVPANTPSRAVMARIGMRWAEGEDFDHPRVAPGDPLRRHVLYRIDAARRAAVKNR